MTMEKFILDKDVHLFCVKATSFPDGIMPAHSKLASICDPNKNRNHFGVSYWYDNDNLYLAAAEYSKDLENIPDGCETYTLKKGNYISIHISDFAKDISQIGQAFEQLLNYPNIDENGCCAECYLPEGRSIENAKDVRCMVRLAD